MSSPNLQIGNYTAKNLMPKNFFLKFGPKLYILRKIGISVWILSEKFWSKGILSQVKNNEWYSVLTKIYPKMCAGSYCKYSPSSSFRIIISKSFKICKEEQSLIIFQRLTIWIWSHKSSQPSSSLGWLSELRQASILLVCLALFQMRIGNDAWPSRSSLKKNISYRKVASSYAKIK